MTDIPLFLLIRLVMLFARLPARLTARQAADLLGFQEADLTHLNACGLLRPLGRPASNAQKYYSTAELLALDEKWLGTATRKIYDWHRTRNGKTSRTELVDN